MRAIDRKTLVLAAAPLLFLAASCGPRTVTARLVTQPAEPPAPILTATPVPPPPSPSRKPLASPPATATRLPASPPPTPRPSRVPPTATATAVARDTPVPTARPSPSPRPTPAATEAPLPPPLLLIPTLRPAASPAPTAPPTASAPHEVSISSVSASPTAAPLSATNALLQGDWDFRADTGSGVIAGTLRFASSASGVTGAYLGLRGNTTRLSNLRVAGSAVSFDLVSPRAIWHLQGLVSGDSIDGTFQTADRLIAWTAVRHAPGSSAPVPTPSRTPT